MRTGEWRDGATGAGGHGGGGRGRLPQTCVAVASTELACGPVCVVRDREGGGRVLGFWRGIWSFPRTEARPGGAALTEKSQGSIWSFSFPASRLLLMLRVRNRQMQNTKGKSCRGFTTR